MNCDGVRGLLSAYLDGELAPGELLRVEQHLRRCHFCADEVDSLRQTVALVSSLDEVEVPADFRAKLRARLVAHGAPTPVRRQGKSGWKGAPRWAVPAAAAAAALALGLSSLPQAADLPGLEGKGTFAWEMNEGTATPVATLPVSHGTNPISPRPGAAQDPDSPRGQRSSAGESGGAQVQTANLENGGKPENPPAPPGIVENDPSGIHAVTHTSGGTTQNRDKLQPQLHWEASVRVRAESPAKALDSLKAVGLQPVLQSDRVILRLPSAQFSDGLKQIKQIWPEAASTTSSKDLAAEIQLKSEQIAKKQAELKNLEKTAATPEEQAARQQLQSDIAQLQSDLQWLQEQVATAVITLEIEQPAR